MTDRLSDEYVASALRDARRFQGAWTGTSGTLAAHTFRLIQERERLLDATAKLEQDNAALRAAVEARLAASRAQKPAADLAAGIMPITDALGDDTGIPQEFREKNKHFSMVPAEPQQPATFHVQPVGSSMSPVALEAAWSGVKNRHAAMMARIKGEDVDDQPQQPAAEKRQRLIGITGLAGSGKNTVASMVPGAAVVQLADPLYAGLAAMLAIPEAMLRQRSFKEAVLPQFGKSPRELLQLLGTEWGRERVAGDVWITIAKEKIDRLAAAGCAVIAIADVRFDNEAAMIRDCGGEVWHVRRGGLEPVNRHVSERGVAFDPHRDTMIENNGSLDDLRVSVDAAFSARRAV